MSPIGCSPKENINSFEFLKSTTFSHARPVAEINLKLARVQGESHSY